jgi:hypothetical protein
MRLYRHGDILLKEVKDYPQNAKAKKVKEFVVAEGEATGHEHLLVADPDTSFRVLTDEGGQVYLELGASAELSHQEHDTITVQPGVFEVVREREYDPYTEEINKVAD